MRRVAFFRSSFTGEISPTTQVEAAGHRRWTQKQIAEV
jgi:hypothetical protein